MRRTHAASRGQAALGAIVLFLAGSFATLGAVVAPVVRDTRAAGDLVTSKVAYGVAEGAIEDSVYRYIEGKTVGSSETITLLGTTVTVTATDVSDTKEIVASGNRNDRIRKVKAVLYQGTGATFNYGVQTDTGGFVIENSASVNGNVYSNGPITGTNSNIIRGSVVSAGSSGVIDGINSTSSAYAHTIRNSDIDGNAYYTTIQNTSVGGASYPGSADQPTTTMPISDALVAEWESDAAAGGTHSSPCPYNISGTVTLGPKKINCDLNVTGTANITLAGPLWVVGNITMSNSADIRVSSSVGNKSVAIIADNPSNRTSSSRVTLQNSVEFFGNGGSKSYVLVLSMNRDAETGGGNKAIIIQNSANGKLLLYAGHGEIELNNSSSLKEVSAYRIRLKNSAQVTYESGLANLLFSSGPTGGYEIDSWQETQ